MKDSEYPEGWTEFATALKEAAGWRCVRCGHPAETVAERLPCDKGCDPARHPGGLNDGRQRVLTVHHLTNNKMEPFDHWWAFLVCCQVCHLHVQAKVDMDQIWMFSHSPWFRPYVAGWAANLYGFSIDRAFVDEYTALLIELAQGKITHEEARRMLIMREGRLV